MQQNDGNTLGIIQNQSPKSKASAANANPAVKAENSDEALFLTAAFKGIPLGEDLIGLTPVIASVADGINTGNFAVRGDYTYGALSPAALNLLVGKGMMQSVAAFQNGDKKAVNSEEQRVINRPSSGAKIKSIRLPSKKLEFFIADKNNKFKKISSQNQQKYLAEYDKQLKRVQDTINNMSAEEFLNARKAYQTEGRNKLSQQMQADYRIEKKSIIEKSIYIALKNNGFAASYAKKRAAERTEELMRNRPALSEPTGGLIKESRITIMDKLAEQAVNNKLNSAKMNIELDVYREEDQ